MESPTNQRPPMPGQLFRAAIEGNTSVLKTLLGLENEKSSDDHVQVPIDAPVDAQNYLQCATYMGNTILHVLSTYGVVGLVTSVCKKDDSLWRVQNKMLETPFHIAAKFGLDKTISALIEFGHNNEEQLKAVLRKKNKDGETALHVAAKRGNKDTVYQLMAVDAMLLCELNNDGLSPLYLAVARGTPDDTDMVNKMLEHLQNNNIDPTKLYSNGLIPSTQWNTTFEGLGTMHNIMALPLVAKDADVSKDMLIHSLASVAGSASMAQLLLEKDKSLAYLQDSDGLFPVHVAARASNVEMVELFLKIYPESCELLDYRGRNFFHVAAEENKPEVFTKLIGDASEDADNPLQGMTKMFLRMMFETDNEGNTPLHLAAEKGHENVMKVVLKMKWLDSSLRNKKGLTPFYLSAIQVKESMKNVKDIEDQIQKYIKKKGARLTEGWFKEIMHCQDESEVEDQKEIDAQTVMSKIQVIGLGAVLITTVAFTAAFTLPGGFNSNDGTPVLGRNYAFKAFIIADTYAFVYSFQCIIFLMNGALSGSGYTEFLHDSLVVPLSYFSSGARCLVIAFGLALYVVLSPHTKPIAILVLVIVLNSILSHVSSTSANPITLIYGLFGKCWKMIAEEEKCCCVTFFFRSINFLLPFMFIFFFAFL